MFPYIAFLIYCALVAVRDVLSEYLFKIDRSQITPVMLLLFFTVATQTVTFAYVAIRGRANEILKLLFEKKHLRDLIYLNVSTLLAYQLYFMAIDSQLGAGLNSFIDYSTCPIFTISMACFIAGNAFDKRTIPVTLICVVGLTVFFIPRTNILLLFQSKYAVGIAYCLLGSLMGGVYRVYLKRFLAIGTDKMALLFVRFLGTTLFLGTVVAIGLGGGLPDLGTGLRLMAYGGVLHFLPLFMTLVVIHHMSIEKFAVLTYSLPIVTFLLASLIGLERLFMTDFLAAALTLGPLLWYEGAFKLPSFTTRRSRS